MKQEMGSLGSLSSSAAQRAIHRPARSAQLRDTPGLDPGRMDARSAWPLGNSLRCKPKAGSSKTRTPLSLSRALQGSDTATRGQGPAYLLPGCRRCGARGWASRKPLACPPSSAPLARMRPLLCTVPIACQCHSVLRPAAATVPCWPPSRRGPPPAGPTSTPLLAGDWAEAANWKSAQAAFVGSPELPAINHGARGGWVWVPASFCCLRSAVGFGLITNRLRLPCSFPAYLATSQPLLPLSSCLFLSPFPSFLHQGLGLLYCLLYRVTGTPPPTHDLQDTIQLFGSCTDPESGLIFLRSFLDFHSLTLVRVSVNPLTPAVLMDLTVLRQEVGVRLLLTP